MLEYDDVSVVEKRLKPFPDIADRIRAFVRVGSGSNPLIHTRRARVPDFSEVARSTDLGHYPDE
jgi:hypothetical protein